MARKLTIQAKKERRQRRRLAEIRRQMRRNTIIEYLANWDNPWPKNRSEIAAIIGLKERTMAHNFNSYELAEIMNEGLERRKIHSGSVRANIYTALVKKALKGNVKAAQEFLDRTEGKVTSRHEITGKDGKDLLPATAIDERTREILVEMAREYAHRVQDGLETTEPLEIEGEIEHNGDTEEV